MSHVNLVHVMSLKLFSPVEKVHVTCESCPCNVTKKCLLLKTLSFMPRDNFKNWLCHPVGLRVKGPNIVSSICHNDSDQDYKEVCTY